MARGVFNFFKSKSAEHARPTSFGDELEMARAALQQSRHADALSICLKILDGCPEHIETLFLTAEIAGRRGESERAMEIYRKVLELKPDLAPAHYKIGNLLKDQQQMEDALRSYDKAVALDPAFAYAFCNRGFVLERLSRWEAALESYDHAIALAPGDALAHYNRAAVLRELGRMEESLAGFSQAISLRPDYFEAYFNRGLLQTELKRWDEALASHSKSIEIAPLFAAAYCGRGSVLRLKKKRNAALADFNRAIEINPSDAVAHCNRGILLADLKQWAAAHASLERAIALRPAFAEAYDSLALLFTAAGQYDAALKNVDKSIELEPHHAAAYYTRANLLVNMKRFIPAIADYDRWIANAEDLRFALGMRSYAKMNVCDWSDLSSDLNSLASGIDDGKMASPPLPVLSLLDSVTLHCKAAQIWVEEEHPPSSELPAILQRRHDKARIGYFSGDFHEHPVALHMAGVFESHDRSKFEVYGFSYGPDTHDSTRTRLKAGFDHFIDVRGLSDQEIALLSRDMHIDIAVDLGGHTGSSRTGIFALRAAPLQINYLGYPGTMGAPYMDYLIGDETVVPAADEAHYVEKIIRLPDCFFPHDSTRSIASTVYSRSQLGLPSDGFVFCCFNNNYKITPTVFDSWARILERVPSGVLWLAHNNDPAADNLRRELTQRGFDAERLIFAKRLASPAEHLARHRAADLFLDTRPYNAHATAIDALWTGLPVLTLPGAGFAGRVAASMLKAVQLPQLIARNAQNYEDIAVDLAENRQLLDSIKDRLTRNRAALTLFDTQRFVRHLESGYLSILERLHSELPAENVYVKI